MKTKIVFIILVFLPLSGFAQVRPSVKGRVIYNDAGVKDVLVVNNNAQAETRTDSLGYFTIKATTGDLFVISDYKVETKKIRYTPDQVKNNLFIINVILLTAEIEEVVINRSNITSENLGIVPKGQKIYTPAERRLKTASSPDITIFPGGMPAIAISTDFIINAITGKTRALKRALEREKKQFTVQYISDLYPEQEFKNHLRIPVEYREGFLFYAAEDNECIALTKSGNNKDLEKRLYFLAVEYLNIIRNE